MRAEALETREIAPGSWEQFFRRFNEFHAGTMVAIEKVGAGDIKQDVAQNVPLRKIILDRSGECSDQLKFLFESSPNAEFCHTVIQPIHVKVQEDKNGGNILRVDSEDGTTLLFFRSGRVDEMLRGLQLVTV